MNLHPHKMYPEFIAKPAGAREADGIGFFRIIGGSLTLPTGLIGGRAADLLNCRRQGVIPCPLLCALQTQVGHCAVSALSPRTSTRNLCVRNFVQSHHRSNICTAADRTEVPRLTCDYPRTRTGIATAHRSMTLKTVTSIITPECNFRGGIT